MSLSESSAEWIEEAMSHNAADGEQWLRDRTVAAVGADRLSAWNFGTVDMLGNIVRRLDGAA